MDTKKQAFIGEMENGYWVEVPAEGKRWMYADLGEAIAKVSELMTPKEVKPQVERPD